MERKVYHKYINFILDDDALYTVGVNVSPRVSEALNDGDELTWQEYLRLIHESLEQYNSDMPDVSPY